MAIMKQLIIMRHGKSSWAEPGQLDFDRPLKNRGMKDATFVAAELVKNGIQPDRIISSPANRAKSTAILVAKGFDYPVKNVAFEQIIYGAGLYDILKLVAQTPDSANTIMLFGHNPTFTDVANHFGIPMFNLPTCGCVGFDLDIQQWKHVSTASVSDSFQIIPSEIR